MTKLAVFRPILSQMFQGYVLVHKQGSQPIEAMRGFKTWSTCMRQCLIGWDTSIAADFSLAGAEVYRGEVAYRFLLEVVCGLQSPLVGETEVMGQFKSFLEQGSVNDSPQLKSLLQQLLTDAKHIRQSHLLGLGSQSYGSLSRRYMRPFKRVHMMGSGQLAQEIVPWLQKGGQQVIIHCRNIEVAQKKFDGFENLSFRNYSEREDIDGGLIIAAPVKSTDIVSHLGGVQLQRVVDLRGESRHDPLPLGGYELVNLVQCFTELENTQSQIKKRVEQAYQSIDKVLAKHSRSEKLRPFGWDDLCA